MPPSAPAPRRRSQRKTPATAPAYNAPTARVPNWRRELDESRADVAQLRARKIVLAVRLACDEARKRLAPVYHEGERVAPVHDEGIAFLVRIGPSFLGHREQPPALGLDLVAEIESCLTGPALPALVTLVEYGAVWGLERVAPAEIVDVCLRRGLERARMQTLRTLMKRKGIRVTIKKRIRRYEQAAVDLEDADGSQGALDDALALLPAIDLTDRSLRDPTTLGVADLDALLALKYASTFARVRPSANVDVDVRDSFCAFPGLALETTIESAILLYRIRIGMLRGLLDGQREGLGVFTAPWHTRAFAKAHRPEHFAEATAGHELRAVCGEPTGKSARGARDDAVGRVIGTLWADSLTDDAWRSEKTGVPGKQLRNLLRHYPRPLACVRRDALAAVAEPSRHHPGHPVR